MFQRSKHFRVSLTLITALLVLFIAVLAGGSLWILRTMHKQLVHTSATVSVVELGKLIATHLAEQPEVTERISDDQVWADFARQVRSLYVVEDGLQYVSVIKDGVTVFHEQRGTLDSVSQSGAAHPEKSAVSEVKLSRRILSVGDEVLPVVVFTSEASDHAGGAVVVEVAIKKDAVEREESASITAIASMFKVALITVVVSFGVCIVLVVWMMRREHHRELKRREEEHLAFAGVMANGIVHDFRNPMSSLKLDVQMLNKQLEKGIQVETDRIKRLSGRILKAVDRMDKVFQEFLYVSRPPVDESERVDLCSVVRECLSILEPRMEEARVKVAVDMPAHPVMVPVYRASFNRALMNILINAEQFAKKDGGVVSVNLRSEDGKVLLEVVDNGSGVPEEDREKIFEMFESRRPGGTGLGLFFAKTAIERAGGTIEVADAPGGGACFRIAFSQGDEKLRA